MAKRAMRYFGARPSAYLSKESLARCACSKRAEDGFSPSCICKSGVMAAVRSGIWWAALKINILMA